MKKVLGNSVSLCFPSGVSPKRRERGTSPDPFPATFTETMKTAYSIIAGILLALAFYTCRPSPQGLPQKAEDRNAAVSEALQAINRF